MSGFSFKVYRPKADTGGMTTNRTAAATSAVNLDYTADIPLPDDDPLRAYLAKARPADVPTLGGLPMDMLTIAVSAVNRHHHYTAFNPSRFTSAEVFFVCYPVGRIRLQTNTSFN